ncbi:MAG: Smr/MutS family protein [Alphaproteobacteria bacterium]
MSGAGKDKRTPSRDERRLWRAAMRDATPIGEPKVEGPAPEAPDAPGEDAAPVAPAAVSPPPPSRPAPDLPELSLGQARGLDKRTALRLKRGQIKLEGRIDLHGHRRAEAHAMLSAFIEGSYGVGKRCVLVITGKGWGSGLARHGREGILRQAVPRWLNSGPLRARVLAIATAQPKDGGTGALYVLLRRRR